MNTKQTAPRRLIREALGIAAVGVALSPFIAGAALFYLALSPIPLARDLAALVRGRSHRSEPDYAT